MMIYLYIQKKILDNIEEEKYVGEAGLGRPI